MNDVAANKTAPSRAQHAAGMRAYQEAGQAREAAIGNRGPMRFGADGRLAPDILEAYWEHGFYIFENVIGMDEIEALRADATNMLERAPVNRDAVVDKQGRPALGIDFARPAYRFTKPLADPWGGTQLLGGRHPSQMTQPAPEDGAPEDVVFLMYSMCQSMPAGLRLHGHPDLLSVAASINGDDFVPFNDAIFVKQPGLGGSVAWHQDGVTHWDNPKWDKGIHGFNFQVQLYPSTVGNCLWVVPGTHKQGRADIKGMVAANGGDEKLPEAIPLACNAGDVTIVNRQTLHGSFANSSEDLRISITIGFHRRSSVLGAKAALSMANQAAVYDEQRIFDRSSVIQVAIDARAQANPGEKRFAYLPFQGIEDQFRYNDDTKERVIKDYFMKDLAI